MKESNQAQEAWRKKIHIEANLTVIAIDDIPTDRLKFMEKGMKLLLDDFKSSLRKEIEERIKAFKEQNSMLKDIHGVDDNATHKVIQELKTVLTILDTCSPTVKEE